MSRKNFTHGICQCNFHWQLAPSPSGVASDLLRCPSFSLSPRCARPLWSPCGVRLLQLQIPSVGCSRWDFVAASGRLSSWGDCFATCQPRFYWRLKAYSYLRSCEGAYSSARSST